MKLGMFNSEGAGQTVLARHLITAYLIHGCCSRFWAVLLPAQHLKKINLQGLSAPAPFSLENLYWDYWLWVTCSKLVFGVPVTRFWVVWPEVLLWRQCQNAQVNLELKRTRLVTCFTQICLFFFFFSFFLFLSNSRAVFQKL